MFNTVVGLVILIVVLVGVIGRPRAPWWPHGMPVFIPAAVGAVIAVVFGFVGFPMLVTIVERVWDASFTLIGLFMLAAALETNRFFEWAALRLARVAGGYRWRLYLLMSLLTIVVTVCLGNDGAILGMTAIVAKLVKNVFPENKSFWLPYIFVTGFLADAFSGFLVPDNLTNIIVASTYHLPFVLFMLQMALPMIFAAVVAISYFAVRFRAELFKGRVSYDTTVLEKLANELQQQNGMMLLVSCGALVLLIAGHLIIGGIFRQPVSFVVVPVALAMLVLVQIRRIGRADRILLAAPWEVLIYALGMFVVITAAMTPSVIAVFLSLPPLHGLIAGEKSVAGVFVTGGLLAAISGLTNNLPATLVGVLLLGTVKTPAMLAVYAVILGVDVGPKLTPYGSLATLMWMSILKKEGIHISWGQCFKENFLVALFALVGSLLGLLVVGRVW